MAEANGWYKTGEGTSIEHVGKLMELVGVDCQQSYNNTIYDLVSELSQGHRIIVSVDSGELWTNTFYDVMTEKIEDLSGIQGADHALIVAGVEVNPENPHDVKVVLTDPGTGKLRVEYSLSDFIDAWKDSNCFMVATEEPAPYQFDPVTCMEVPSGFATDYNISSMAIDNDFLLADNEIGILDDYTPTYSEINHIDTSIYFSDIKPIDLVDTIEDHNPLDSDFIELLS